MNRRIILVSALTAPEKIKPLLRGGMWVYAGKDLNGFYAFKKCLGNDMIHASPAQFREFTISNRYAFVKWTESVHSQYGHDLTHWLSDTFSSNPYISNLFSDFMNLAWLKSILDECPEKDVVFIAESHAMLSVADAISSEDNGNEIYKYGFNKERIRVLCQIGSSILSGYVSLLSLIVRYMFAYAYRTPDHKDNLQKVSVIIDTYVFENSFNKEGGFVNKYFSELHEYLSTKGFSVCALGGFYKISFKRFRSIFKSIYQCDTRFILLEDFLKPLDYLCSIFYPLIRLWRFERVKDLLGIRMQPLVDEGNWMGMNSSNYILSLLLNKLPKRIRENGMNPVTYINWSENQPIQKAIIAGFHRNFTELEVVGGKPFIPPPNNLNLFHTENERIFGYSPDRVITCGKKLSNIFSIYDKGANYDTGASFRYGYLWDLIDSNQISSGDISKRRIISVFLPYSKSISEHVLASSKKAIHNAIANGWNIKIKVHPTLTSSDSAALLKEYDMKSNSIELTRENMETLLPETSAVITSASSAAIEAICLGIPVISIGVPIGLDLNIIGYLPPSMWRLAFADDDVDSRLNKWALSHPLVYEERKEVGRKVLMDFFENNTNKSLQIYLESLDNAR